MAKVGIDTSFLGVLNATDANAGYTPLGNVTAVSMMHVSGTGGAPTYGLVSQMPLYGNLADVNLADNMTYWQNRSLEAEHARVGLFTTTLLNGVKIDLTSTQHAGIMRYTFPRDSSNSNLSMAYGSSAAGQTGDAHVLVDLTHVLPSYSIQDYSQTFIRGDVHLRTGSNGHASYYGSATYAGGWGQPDSNTVFFCANFSASDSLLPTDDYVEQATSRNVPGAGTFYWTYDPVVPLNFTLRPSPDSHMDSVTYTGSGQGIGAVFSWSHTEMNSSAASIVESRVGISHISAKQACQSLATELPSNLTFEDVVETSKQEWESSILSTIEVVDDASSTSSNNTLKRMLYSALYQTGLMPTDKTGENPYWATNDENPYYDDHYTIWDTYRTVHPLYHLIFTSTYSRVLKGLVSIFTNEGFLPAGRAANWNGRVQGGTHANMILADAFTKDVKSLNGTSGSKILDVDWNEAYNAVLNDARTLPVRNVDPVAFDGATKEGRGALDEQLHLKYITRNHSRSISRGLEYAQNDFAIYSIAGGLNRSDDLAEFRDRADWWQNQWNPNANITLNATGTFTGFPGPRDSDGSWNYTDYGPINCTNCGWSGDIYEATVWETAFNAAPHDMAKVIKLMGGDESFVKRLDASFVPGLGEGTGNANNDAGTAIFNPGELSPTCWKERLLILMKGNEPSFLTPFLYNYVPKHNWKTVNQTRAIVDEFYSDQRNGYPGNTDSGALPSWLVFNLIGLVSLSTHFSFPLLLTTNSSQSPPSPSICSARLASHHSR